MTAKTQEAYVVRGYKTGNPVGEREELHYFWKADPQEAFEMAKKKRNKMFFDEGYREQGNIVTFYHLTAPLVWDKDLNEWMDPA